MAQKSTLSDDTIKEPAPTSSTSKLYGQFWYDEQAVRLPRPVAVEKDLGGHKKEPQKSTKAKTERG